MTFSRSFTTVFSGKNMTLVTCQYCATTSSSTTTRRRWHGTRKKRAVFAAGPPRASDDDDDDDDDKASRIVIEEIMSASTPMQTLGITTEEEEEEEEEDAAKRRRRRSNVRKAFSSRVKLIHPDVCFDERSAEATEKCVRAYAWLLSEEAKSTRDEEENTYDDVYASVFVNEILCVGASNCPSHSNCTVTAREYFRVNPKTKAARFERSETSNPLGAATEAEMYRVHLAVEQCPRRCVHWLDEKQTRACEEELQKAIDGLELIDDTALRLDYMISAFAAENRLIERELRAAENRRERNREAADNASWWK
jgi:ferredoxin